MLTVRAMQFADVEQVYGIEINAHRAPWSKDILSDCILVGYDCRVLEKEEEGQIRTVGYIICRRSFNTLHILNLCIAVSQQDQGYGKFLLKAVLDSLAQGIDTIVLEVRPSNKKAMALYQAFGFSCDTVKKGYYKDASGEEDAFFLKKVILSRGSN